MAKASGRPPIDPATGGPFALSGRVVTMNAARGVLDDSVVWVDKGAIVAVLPAGQTPPGYETVPVTPSGGTVYPGLIELHNHLPYDILQLWAVPKPYQNRDQWSGPSTPDYHRLITGPMAAIGKHPDLVAAVVRYVETRCLLGGTTTSQGVTLSSSSGLIKHFRGLIRNVEKTDDPDLPAATTHIADVEAKQFDKFLARVSKDKKLILHLAEGTNTAAHEHFQALQSPTTGKWAITKSLIGIHCVPLNDADFAVMAAHHGSMVWSPLSNLLLYGCTANVGAALAHGVPVALGSDWSPSGSKNLLCELKAARGAAAVAGAGTVSDADLVAMVTTTPAAMLGWDRHLGSLEAGKKADLLVVAGAAKAPYTTLVGATEADVTLVVINGVPRAGTPALMAALGIAAGALETLQVGGQDRALNLAQVTADPDVEIITVAEAIDRLRKALHDLPTAVTPKRPARRAAKGGPARMLAVGGLVNNRRSPRPHLPFHGHLTGPDLPPARTLTAERKNIAAAGPLPALTLSPLTAIDDPAFYASLQLELNLTDDFKAGLAVYGPPAA